MDTTNKSEVTTSDFKFAPYSFSKINTWATCPRQFKYKYIDKLKVPPKDMTPLLKGSAIHSILENYPEPGTHKLSEKYQHIVDSFLEKYKYLFDYPNKREVPIGLDFNLEPCEYSNKCLFRGFVDFVFFDNDMIHIIDWKSGKTKEQKWQNYNQLMYYSIYFFKKYKKLQKIQIRYIYVEHFTENELLLERKYLDNYISDFKKSIESIEISKFEKNVQKLCEYCDYKDFCTSDL